MDLFFYYCNFILQSADNKKSTKKPIVPIVILTSLLIIAFVLSADAIVSKATQRIVNSYTDELALHDMGTIQMYVSDRKTTLLGINREFSKKDFETLDDVLTELSHKNSPDDVDYCILVDGEGKIYLNNGKSYLKYNKISRIFEQHSSVFALRYEDAGVIDTESGEYMLYGMHFDKKITVQSGDETVEFVGIAIANRISKIRNRLSITCFGDKGSASLVEYSGEYIVPDDNLLGSAEYSNFYKLISEQLDDKSEAERLKESILDGQNVSFWLENALGNKKYISVYCIEDSDWNFVIALDESVFSDQTGDFVRTIVLMFSLMFICFVLIVIFSFSMQKKLKNMYKSNTDGVYNRRFYEDTLVDLHVNALAIMDLDKLKVINDSYGHIAGDCAIKKVGEIIVECVSDRGMVCRFGGDEFIVGFTENLSDKEFALILEDIRKTINSTTFEDYNDLKISMSIGGYYAEGETGDLLKKADELLYKAKRVRNTVVTNIE